jgi:membrane protein
MTEDPAPPQTENKGPPRSPAELDAPGWKESLRRAAEEFKTDRGSLIAAGMAFYWFLAIFPALIAAVGIVGLVHAGPQAVHDIQKAITAALPGDAAETLAKAVKSATDRPAGSSLVATIVGLLLALWSASAGMVALQRGMDVAYDVAEERKLVAKRGVALLLIVAAAVLGGVASALIVFGAPLGDAVKDHLPFGEGVFVTVWTVARWVLGLGTLSVLFALFYYLGPNRPTPRWTWLSPGGVVATVVWLAASLGFSFYVTSLGSYVKTYGSFTGVVVLLLWLFVSALAVVVGAELNAELERQGELERRRARRPSRSAPVGAGDDSGAAHRSEPQEVSTAPEPDAPRPPEDWSDQDAWLSYGR